MMNVPLLTITIASLGIVITAIEDILLPSRLFRDNLLDWRYCLAFHPRLRPRRRSPLADCAFGPAAFRAAAIVRIAAVVTTIFMFLYVECYATIGLTAILVSYFYLFYRIPFSLDGADQMMNFTIVCLLVMSLDDGSGRYIRLGAAVLTLHAMISYLTSGIAKIVSPIWRSGDGLSAVMSTAEFGSRLFTKMISPHRCLRLIASWTVMIGHVTVGLCIAIGGPVIWGAVIVSLGFHVTVAMLMRLNNFVWAFAAARAALPTLHP